MLRPMVSAAMVVPDGEREAVVSLPENQADAARTARAAVALWAAPGESYPAVLRELSPTADPVTRTYQARFTIADDVPGVELGMTSTVHLSAGSGGPAFVLPASALVEVGSDHLLADPEPLRMMLEACERTAAARRG